ncbi:MAG: DMT family transporter [Gammaproteobacteria bacterium]|nr:DMT family transporter [Gammaproteobacteria bacterium]MBT7814784.1 DMT family transporter [Gammaproteobacteria bacterium]
MFGSAFLLIEISLKSFSPSIIAFSRVFLAAIILLFYSLVKKYSFVFIRNNFILLFVLGLSGTSIPFFLISWAQQTINSSETGILIGFMPIFTVLGSHFYFKYEKLNIQTFFGFMLGFLGLFILLLNNDNSISMHNNFLAKFAVILGAFFYALNALLVKKIIGVHVIPLSASVMLFSSFQLFVLLFLNNDFYNINFNFYLDSIISLLIMSVFSTALATVIYYKIIHDYGPSFLSLVNYPIPIFAFFIGVVFLKESANILSIISLFLIIASIYLSQKKDISKGLEKN